MTRVPVVKSPPYIYECRLGGEQRNVQSSARSKASFWTVSSEAVLVRGHAIIG